MPSFGHLASDVGDDAGSNHADATLGFLLPSGWFVYSAASETFSLTLLINDDGDARINWDCSCMGCGDGVMVVVVRSETEKETGL